MKTTNPYAHIGHTRPVRSKLFPASMTGNAESFNACEVDENNSSTDSGQSANASGLHLAKLFHGSPIVSVLAQVDDITLAWGGRISCTLKLSIGNIVVHTNRDVLRSDISDGSWIRTRLMLARSPARNDILLSVVRMFPADTSAPTTSWLPVASHARNAHIQRLRALLAQLEPSMQAVFMGAMSHVRVQQEYLRRVSASDHHGYPGGLFDHSVEAAESAMARNHLNARERGIAALVCLLFDLGKTRDPFLRPDADRLLPALAAHSLSMSVLQRTLSVVERHDSELVAQIRMLMSGSVGADTTASGVNLKAVQQAVHASILQAWKLDAHQHDSAAAFKGGQP